MDKKERMILKFNFESRKRQKTIVIRLIGTFSMSKGLKNNSIRIKLMRTAILIQEIVSTSKVQKILNITSEKLTPLNTPTSKKKKPRYPSFWKNLRKSKGLSEK